MHERCPQRHIQSARSTTPRSQMLFSVLVHVGQCSTSLRCIRVPKWLPHATGASEYKGVAHCAGLSDDQRFQIPNRSARIQPNRPPKNTTACAYRHVVSCLQIHSHAVTHAPHVVAYPRPTHGSILTRALVVLNHRAEWCSYPTEGVLRSSAAPSEQLPQATRMPPRVLLDS